MGLETQFTSDTRLETPPQMHQSVQWQQYMRLRLSLEKESPLPETCIPFVRFVGKDERLFLPYIR